jgi:hypothetical protein
LRVKNLSAGHPSEPINRGFSNQASAYDERDSNNRILIDLRKQVLEHVKEYLQPQSHILELNAGTGIDALSFVAEGHRVHATDLSDGMVEQIRLKIIASGQPERFTCQQLSFENLNKVNRRKFDYVFSNFGGLNCLQDLSLVSRHLPELLNHNAYVTLVLMPPVCLWELLGIFKGRWTGAFRRLNKNGTIAHVEGEYFKTYYHPLQSICSAFKGPFSLVACEGLAALSPPPHRPDLPIARPRLYKLMRNVDGFFRTSFPFNRWADHIIVTFQYTAKK